MPVNRNLTQRIRQALYALKKDYGGTIYLYKLVSTETDVRTGRKTVVTDRTYIRRAIVLPVTVKRDVKQSISLISSNKEFVQGGTSDIGKRDFIIDRRDCRHLTELTADDWLVYKREKYQIATVETFEEDAGWIITAKKLVGEVPESHVSFGVTDQLVFVSVATAEVE